MSLDCLVSFSSISARRPGTSADVPDVPSRTPLIIIISIMQTRKRQANEGIVILSTVYALPGIGLDLVYVGYDSTIGILKTFRYIFVLRNLFGCTEAYVLAYTYGKEFESYFF